ncbi:helix-turn-helix domain-containing protein [Chitinophaga polysaccharea]|uniref:helix-turn-helix domain-containing protein n=1 Tax=Chitinophaga polysaccharea TaxID=1293035 RepID=UPI00115AB999|nr:helix-turn-helix transcriptional regulator [Chitinophaga polysaccharea]
MKNRYTVTNKAFNEQLAVWLQSIGDRLSALRKGRKESLKKVSKAIKMSPALLSKIEKGQHDFKLMHLIRICRYYKVNVLDVIE